MKYLNIIILSIIILIVGILVYRWYFNKTEGFFGLTQDDNLVKTNDLSTYDYLWSNNLYLEQFPKDNPPENLIVLQKPRLTDTNTGKILGTMITDKLDELNRNTTIVERDVKKPTGLQKIFTFNNTSEPVFNKLLTADSLNEYKKRNDAVLNTLEQSLTDFDEIFNQALSKVNNNFTVELYRNSLGEEGETKNFITDEDGNLVIDVTNEIYNGIKFPIGSTVEISIRNGQSYKYYIPTENAINNDNIVMGVDEIIYDKIFAGTGLSQHSFNPFGSYGLGWKNYLENKEQLHKNANRMFNYNYGIGNNGQPSGLTEKNALQSYIDNLVNSGESVDSSEELSNSGLNKYVQFDGKRFFVNHIIEINNNDTTYPINAKRNIVRNVYNYGSGEGYDYSSHCGSKKGTVDSQYIGMYEAEYCRSNQTKIKSARDNCIKGRRRVWCAEGKPGETVIFSDSHQKNKVVKQIYVNREWISAEDYSGFYNLNLSSLPSYKIEIKYGSRENYNNELSKLGFDINQEIFSQSNTNKSVIQLFQLNTGNLFDIHIRNILSCLWYDGEVTLENYYTGTEGIEFTYDTEFEGDHQGPKYSPYVTIKFVNKSEAQNFVAYNINNVQNNILYRKFRNPTLSLDNITIPNFKKLTANNGNNIPQIKENILTVLDNYNRYSSNEQQIEDNEITTIKTAIESTISGFSNEIKLYYINFMMTLPKFKIDNEGNTIREGAINLANGQMIDNELSYKIRNVKITINKNSNPIYKVLVTNISKLRQDLQNFKEKFIADSSKYSTLITQIENNQLKHYPLTIHRPIAPPRYKALGDIVEISGYTNENSSAVYNKNPAENLEEYGCVPEHCVVEARPWLVSDKVYELRSNGQYLALFRNPYLNTFRAVTQVNATPEGAVEKIVACVAKSNIVNDIKHADKCANEYKRGYESVVNNNNLDRGNILFDKQEARLQNMLAERQETIDGLKKTISQVQKQDRQSIVINHSINRKRFQDLLDKQVYNMDQLITNLYSIISINVNMEELVARLQEKGITRDKISEIIDTIRKSEKIYSVSSSSTPIDVATTASGNEPDAVIAEPAKLQRIIYRTRDGREQEMILRSLVESSCGCYFTDEEVIRTR